MLWLLLTLWPGFRLCCSRRRRRLVPDFSILIFIGEFHSTPSRTFFSLLRSHSSQFHCSFLKSPWRHKSFCAQRTLHPPQAISGADMLRIVLEVSLFPVIISLPLFLRSVAPSSTYLRRGGSPRISLLLSVPCIHTSNSMPNRCEHHANTLGYGSFERTGRLVVKKKFSKRTREQGHRKGEEVQGRGEGKRWRPRIRG